MFYERNHHIARSTDNVVFKSLLRNPIDNPRLWANFAWLDIVQSYRRTFLGPVWITINLAIVATAMTVVYGALFGIPTKQYAGYLVCGLIAWNWILALMTENGNTFIQYAHFLKSTPVNKAQFVWANACKQFLVFSHHFLVFLACVVVGIIPVTIYTFLIFPAVALMFLFSIPATAVAAILFARYRDLQRLVTSIMTALMLVTPIFWQHDQLTGWRRVFVHYNPFFYIVEVIRSPLLGNLPDPQVMLVFGVMTVAMWIVGAVFYSRYERYVIFWI